MMWSSVKRRVRFSETDASGRVHFTNILRYVEEAEHELLKEKGIEVLSENTGWPRVRVTCDYRQALTFDDEFVVVFQSIKASERSLVWSFELMKAEQLIASGEMITVRVDEKGKALVLEDSVRGLI